MSHPVGRIDEVVHQRTRLGILAVLHELPNADFTYLRDELGLTDGNLSRHIQVLEEAGFVQVQKTFEKRRPRTLLKATAAGRRAFEAELAALKELVERSSR